MSKIVLADPTHSLRSAFVLLLRCRLGIQEVEEVADLEHLDQALKTAPPDLLLLDWRMVNMDSEALQRWHSRQPGLKIVVMSVDAEDAAPAIQAGANGFIYKGAAPEVALDSLRQCLIQ